MSGRLVKEVLEYAPEDLPPAKLLVLVCLAEDARERDRVSRYSSIDTLVHRTRCSRSTVKNALGDLAARSLIKPLHRARLGIVQHYYLAELGEHHRKANTT